MMKQKIEEHRKNLKKLSIPELEQEAKNHQSRLANLSDRVTEHAQKISGLKQPEPKLTNGELRKLGMAYEKVSTKQKVDLSNVELRTWVKFEKRDSELDKLQKDSTTNHSTFGQVSISGTNDKNKKSLIDSLAKSLYAYNEHVEKLKKFETNFAKFVKPYNVMHQLNEDYKTAKELSTKVALALQQPNIEVAERQRLNGVHGILSQLETQLLNNYRRLDQVMKERDNYTGPLEKLAVKENIKLAIKEGHKCHAQYVEQIDTIKTKLNSTQVAQVVDKTEAPKIKVEQAPLEKVKVKTKGNKVLEKAQGVVEDIQQKGKEVIANVVNAVEDNIEYPVIHTKTQQLITTLNEIQKKNKSLLLPEVNDAATALASKLTTAVNNYQDTVKNIRQEKGISVQDLTTKLGTAKDTLKQQCSSAMAMHETAIKKAPGFLNEIKMALNGFFKSINIPLKFDVEKTSFISRDTIKEQLVALKAEATSQQANLEAEAPRNRGPHG